uniref:Lysosome-associated membrane glycoprotein 2 n=1 Tax=Echinostoma caproni TaxID=27848 RepID=A0A183AXT4_9TREM
LEFKFKRLPSEGDGGHFSLDTVSFNYTVTDSLFPETNETVTRFTIIQQPQFSAPIGSFFQCMSKQTWKLSDVPDLPTNGSQPDVFVSTSNLKAEAFRASADQNFVGQKSECSADFVPNKVVPIVIGVALAVMIVIALVTFIVGSRRRQSGYQEI